MQSNFIKETYKEEYKKFSPLLINRSFEWKDKQINILLEKTMHSLGELCAYIKLIKNIDDHIPLFISLEVISSSRLEGVKCFIQQLYIPNNSTSVKYKNKITELLNYKKSITWGVDELKKYPLSIRLIKQTHNLLFEDVSDSISYRGKMRYGVKAKINNKDFDYHPPSKQDLKFLINDAKHFWRNDNLELPQLIKVAISLYQFETILPFLDGNGRTARTLIILEMLSLKFIPKPLFSLSSFFEKNKIEYYKRLNLIRTKNDIEQWIKFFLKAVNASSIKSMQIIDDIQNLKEEYALEIKKHIGAKRQKIALLLVDLFFKTPYLNVNEISEALSISFQSANVLSKELENIFILRELSSLKRNRIFFLKKYVDLFY